MAKRTFSGTARSRTSRRNRRAGETLPDTPPAGVSARAAALGLLSRRDYTSAELSARLIDRGYSAEDVAQALNDMTAAGAVNDARVAAAHVRTAVNVKGRGRHRVSRELAERGLSRQAIDDALSAIEPGGERDALIKILKRKRYPEHPTLAERQRMYQHLLRRGFAGDLIRRVVGGATWSAEDESE